MNWHPPRRVVSAYRAGELDTAQAWSIEAHLAACGECRPGAGSTDADRLDAIWQATVDVIDQPRARTAERVLQTFGVPQHLARLLAATPSLTVPWLLSVAAVLGFGLVMAWNATNDPDNARAGLYAFLLLAPIFPVAGVAVAFGPAVDPAHEVAMASPFHGFRLLFIRTVAVVATSMMLALVLALFLPGAGLLAAAWILPGLALASVSLAASTFVSPLVAGVTSIAVWLIGATVAEAGPDTLTAFGWRSQLIFALILVVAAAVFTMRREALEIRRR